MSDIRSDCSCQGGPQQKMKPTIVVVDDERSIADTLVMILNRNGFQASAFYSAVDAANKMHEACPNILLSDVAMPKMDGIELAIATRGACPTTRIVLISGQAATADYLQRARSRGYHFEFLPKPIEPDELLERLRA